jgi:hypothetical protein
LISTKQKSQSMYPLLEHTPKKAPWNKGRLNTTIGISRAPGLKRHARGVSLKQMLEAEAQ